MANDIKIDRGRYLRTYLIQAFLLLNGNVQTSFPSFLRMRVAEALAQAQAGIRKYG